jgi:hypothetical protein
LLARALPAPPVRRARDGFLELLHLRARVVLEPVHRALLGSRRVVLAL